MSDDRNGAAIQERIRREGRRPADDGILGTHASRFLVGLSLSFLVIVSAARWPAYAPEQGVHIEGMSESEAIPVQPHPEVAQRPAEDAYSALTAEVYFERRIEPASAAAEEEDEDIIEERVEELPRMERLTFRNALRVADQMPDLVGGLRSLYLRIHYPKAARDQGIEGLVLLDFVVERDGSVIDIIVSEPLHPLLDSAAVRAVRKTKFVPGRQNDEPVRVSMRLPIRFQLINTASHVAEGTDPGIDNEN